MRDGAAKIAVGLVVRRSAQQLAAEPFYAELVAGMESVLHPAGADVILRLVPSLEAELAEYRRWGSSGVVSACVLTDVVPDDPRPGVLHEVGLAGMVVGDTAPDWGLAAVHTDGYGQMRDLMRLVVDLGHRRVGRVSGPGELVHTQIRDRAFDESVGELGLTGARVEGDYTAEGGADATRRLLAGDRPPTLIVYDNDVMAVAGLAVAQERGVDVPDELSIVAWDDSVHCRLSIPPIGAMNHDARGSGELAGAILVELLGGGTPRDVATPAPLWVPRSSVRSLPAPVQG